MNQAIWKRVVLAGAVVAVIAGAVVWSCLQKPYSDKLTVGEGGISLQTSTRARTDWHMEVRLDGSSRLLLEHESGHQQPTGFLDMGAGKSVFTRTFQAVESGDCTLYVTACEGETVREVKAYRLKIDEKKQVTVERMEKGLHLLDESSVACGEPLC